MTDATPKLRLNAKNFFLTWPNISDAPTPLIWMQELKMKMENATIDYIVVAKELHEDGTPHFHAVVILKTKKDFTNANKTFMITHNGTKRNGNYQTCRNVSDTIKYVKKDKDFVEEGTCPAEQTNPRENLLEKATTMTEPEFMNYCCSNKIEHTWAKYWLAASNNDCTITEDTLQEGIIDNRVTEKMNEYVQDPIKNLVIIGPTGVGKTSWALKHLPKPILIVSHLDTLRSFRPRYHKSILFDDMNFTHLHREAQLALLDNTVPRSIHVRYAIVNIPAFTTKCFTANYDIFKDDEAINRRLNKIFI